MTTAMSSPAQRLLKSGDFNAHNDIEALRAFASDGHTSAGELPQAILRPRSTDEVVAAVQWANKVGMGIVPVSSTGRRRRGDTVPARSNSVILDLSGMQRLLNADARDKIVIIEAGVDFGCIDRLLQPYGLRVFRPLAPRAGKSVIASYLEREPIMAANDHWDVSDPFGGTSLVLGNGHCVPTGGAAVEGTLAEQLAHGHRQMLQMGPMHLDHLRVVLGVMTWAAVYCERIPTLETAWFASADALEPVINLARDLLHRRLGNALFIVDRVQLALLLARDESQFRDSSRTLPPWTLFVSLSAGKEQPAEKMAWQSADLNLCASQHGVRLADALQVHLPKSSIGNYTSPSQPRSETARSARIESSSSCSSWIVHPNS